MFTVYKVINLVNKKYYIGVHKTKNPNDWYLGSGRAIKAAIIKHGRENFRKDVLFIFENQKDAYDKEIELTDDFNISETYNMRRGGVGGFTVENARKGAAAANLSNTGQGGSKTRDRKTGVFSFTREQLSECGRKGGLAHKGRAKSAEHKEKLRQAAFLQWKRIREAKSKSGDQLLITV